MKTSQLLTTLAVVATLATINVAAAATIGEEDQTSQGKQLGQRGGEQMEEVKQAVENGDYDAWAELTADHPKTAEMFENVNADNFHLLNEMHQAKQDGDMEKAKEIAEELGFEPGQKGQRGNNGQVHNQMREEVRTALENRDYDAWGDAMVPPIFEYINESNFDTFADMHEAMQAGDKDTAEALRAELGLPEREAAQKGMKMGQRGAGASTQAAQ